MSNRVHFSSHPLVHKIFDEDLKKLIFKISKRFNKQRNKLLNDRQILKAKRSVPEISPYTKAHKEEWNVGEIAPILQKRRVEIIGPACNTKLVAQMFSRNENGDSADAAIMDFEDSMKPSFDNVLLAYLNCLGAVKGDLEIFEKGKTYQMNSREVYPMIRIRGLHLDECNISVEDEATSASLMDLATTSYLTSHLYQDRGLNPKFYIPKIESALEAKFWNDVFIFLEEELHLKRGHIKVSLLIETYPAACAVEEILYELRERAVALNVGRLDKIFSDIKIFAKSKEHIFCDRSLIGLHCEWMEKYAKRVIKICHKHGALAIGGMTSFKPGKTEMIRHEQNQKIQEDKKREAHWGHDGCWVSHPYFIRAALSVFTKKNQVEMKLEDFNELCSIEPQGGGPYSFLALRQNVRLGICYLYHWSKDIGRIALEDQIEDLASFEISRAQVWQWNYHQVELDNFKKVSESYLRELFEEVEQEFLADFNDVYGLKKAKEWCFELFTENKMRDFLVCENDIYDQAEEYHYEIRPTV